MNLEEDDEDVFVKTTLKDACHRLNLDLLPNKENGIFYRFSNEKVSLLIHVATLGSVRSVTSRIEPDGLIRSLSLTPTTSNSQFITTHLISWLIQGGKYGLTIEPHLQGLSMELIRKLLTYLPRYEKLKFSKANKLCFKTFGTRG